MIQGTKQYSRCRAEPKHEPQGTLCCANDIDAPKSHFCGSTVCRRCAQVASGAVAYLPFSLAV
eukprot:5003998-Amphidinium_carterae.1